jgi:hypothetical protein
VRLKCSQHDPSANECSVPSSAGQRPSQQQETPSACGRRRVHGLRGGNNVGSSTLTRTAMRSEKIREGMASAPILTMRWWVSALAWSHGSCRSPMVQTGESFLECFRNNLLGIGIDPRPYGTHSFRRGGCQYLAVVLRWPLRQICTWGG